MINEPWPCCLPQLIQEHSPVTNRGTVDSVPNPLATFLTPLTKDTWNFIRRHPITVSVLLALCMAFAIISVLSGFVPMVVILLPIALFVTVMLSRRLHKSKDTGRAEVLATIAYVAMGTALTLGLIQLVPYGRSQVPYNASITGEMKWDSPRTRELTVNACYGCHSNQIEYPSYASIAPISWAVQHHIEEGMSELNFSTFSTDMHGFNEILEVIDDGSMPPSYYTALGRHPEARLSDSEMKELVTGLHATLTQNGVNSESGRGGSYDND
jgi:hypothetical protein